MTVSSQTSTATFVGNGVATAFPLPFRFFDNGDIRAYFIDSVTGAATQMVLGTDYTLIGAGEPEVDGNALSLLTTTAPLAIMRGLYVERVMQQVQGTDIVNQGQFFASTHEDVFDRLTMLIQQANANSSGAIRVAIGEPDPDRLAPAAQRANLLLGFDSIGKPIVVAPVGGSASELALLLSSQNGDSFIGSIGSAAGAVVDTVGGVLDRAISTFDFMTDALRADALIAAPVLDHTASVQAFFDALAVAEYPSASLVGNLRVTGKVSLIASKTKVINCNATIFADFTAEDEVVLVKDTFSPHFLGELEVIGGGGYTYGTRTNGTGLKIDNCARIHFDSLRTDYFKYDGVQVINGADVGGGNSNLWSIGKLRADACGPGRIGTALGVVRSITNVVTSGSAGSFAQRAVLSFSAIPAGLRQHDLLAAGGSLHHIESFDYGPNTVTIFPWLPGGSGIGSSANFFMGGALYTKGGDSGVGHVGQLDVRNGGIAYNALSLYPASVGSLSAQFCSIGVRVGRGVDGAAEGGLISTMYAENNDFDVVRCTNYLPIGFKIENSGTVQVSKCFALSPLDGSNKPIQPYSTLAGIELHNESGNYIARPTLASSARTLSLNPKPGVVETLRANTATVTLVKDDDIERVFNCGDAILFVAGSGNNTAPSGAITFVPPTGCTINGGVVDASATFASFSGPCTFYIRKETANYVVQRCDQESLLSASATYDWPSLAVGAQQSTTVPVTGATVGDFASASFGAGLSGTQLWAEVTSSGVVTVYQRNGTAAPVDLASGNIFVRVRKRT